MRKTGIIITLLLLPLILNNPAQAQEPLTCDANYTIRTGDTLADIAEEYYGDRTAYRDIVEATNLKAETDSSYTEITNPSLIESGWKICLPGIDDLSSKPASEIPAFQDLLVTELKNAQYQTEWTGSGQVRLVNGEYRAPATPGSATELVIQLTDWVTFGELNGQNLAAVVLVTEPGGSGTFYDLAVVVEQNGQPVNVASTTLGDRVKINSLDITENEIVVDMVTHGPNDPMCCPTQRVIQTYTLEDNRLRQTSQENTGTVQTGEEPQTTPARERLPEEISFNAQGLANQVTRVSVNAQPYDDSIPSGPTGAPEHVTFLFDGEERLRIYPIKAYEDIWESEGNETISQNVTQLRTILANRPEVPQNPLPALPPTAGYNDLAVQVIFLDFDNGSGISFIGRFSQDASPVSNSQLKYFFQGLTHDNRYYVSFEYPVSTSALPETLTSEQQTQAANKFYQYLSEIETTLNSLAPGEFTPDLTRLDALIQSLTVPDIIQ